MSWKKSAPNIITRIKIAVNFAHVQFSLVLGWYLFLSYLLFWFVFIWKRAQRAALDSIHPKGQSIVLITTSASSILTHSLESHLVFSEWYFPFPFYSRWHQPILKYTGKKQLKCTRKSRQEEFWPGWSDCYFFVLFFSVPHFFSPHLCIFSGLEN